MKLSETFVKTSKTVPADEVSRNAQLLIKAGYIYKEMAGVYTFLPLGLRVLNKISDIVRSEMNKVGGQEIFMPALQVKERYQLSGRWDDKVVDDWFKTKLLNGTELGLGFSHEEDLSPLLTNFLSSYKDLPVSVYQIQTKFRNELRSKSGLMRGREFLMKDMYSYSISEAQHQAVYSKIQAAYTKIYHRLGIGDKTYLTFASGGSFSKFSHEFQTLSDAGEDTIYLDYNKKIAINKEVFTDDVLNELGLRKDDLKEAKSIEVGNIFSLGTKFTKPFNLAVLDEKGALVTPIMGCYGLGISRVMGTIAELTSDENGLAWPEAIAPAKVIIVRLAKDDEVVKAADELYADLTEGGIEVIYDDRDLQSGEKFADADLLGIPYRVVISKQNVQSGKFELKKRQESNNQHVKISELIKILDSHK